MVIIVVGMPGSGKEQLVKAAAARGFGHVRMGDVVRDFARKAGMSMDDASVGGFASAQREEWGDDVWAIRTLERLPPGNAVIDGSRSLAEIGRFREELGDDLVVVGVLASEQDRFRRLSARGRDDDPNTIEELRVRDARELSWGIGEALEGADILIVNDSTLQEFREACDQVLDMVLSPDWPPD